MQTIKIPDICSVFDKSSPILLAKLYLGTLKLLLVNFQGSKLDKYPKFMKIKKNAKPLIETFHIFVVSLLKYTSEKIIKTCLEEKILCEVTLLYCRGP